MGCGVVGVAKKIVKAMTCKSRGAKFMPETQSGAISSCSVTSMGEFEELEFRAILGLFWPRATP